MNTILVIAKNTFRQTIRDKILYGIFTFGLLFIGSTVILGSLALEDNIFIIRNLGLAGIYIFSLIITIFLASSLIYSEVENRTTYILLAKPVARSSIIIGKFLGLLLAIATTTLLMTLAYIIIVVTNGGGIDYSALAAVGIQMFEMALLIAIIILFSIFTTPLGSIIYTILIVYIGHSLSFMLLYAERSGNLARSVLYSIYYLFPNLEKFNIRNLVVHNISVSSQDTLIVTIYAITYTVFLIYLAQSLFNRKDL